MPLQKVSRADILKSSIRIFRQRGYYRTSMTDLADALGLTKGAFYHHFKDKKTVMKEALQMSASWFDRKVFAIAYQEGLSDQEKLTQISVVTYKAFVDQPGGCFFANTILETAHVEDTFRPEIMAFFKAWEKALLHIFSGNVTPENLNEQVEQIMAEVEGSIILMQLHQNPAYLKKALDRSLTYLSLPANH